MKRGRPCIKLSLSEKTKNELAQRVKTEKNAVDRDRMRAVLMTTDGTRSIEEIARQLGRAKSGVQTWLDAFVEGGVEKLLEHRKAPGKSSPMQAGDVQKDLAAGLREGRWRTGPQMRAWLKKTHGIKLSQTQGYYWLGKLGGALKVPRPVHTKKDEALATDFREHLYEKLHALNIPAGSGVKVWVQDEARIGLHDAHRRCWSLKGVRVVKKRQQEYDWCYVCGALEVVSGASEFRLLPTVGLELTRGFLEQIAQSDPDAHHVIIWDQAGFHFRPGDGRLPERVHVLPLPAYSPELNPAEKIWDILKDAVCNQVYSGIRALEGAACAALQPFIREAERVRSLVGNGWLYLQANSL